MRHQRHKWRIDPLSYFEERLGVARNTFDWELLTEYANHVWDGTRNPFKTISDCMAQGKWVGVESATGVGKTFFGACLVFQFLECYSNSIVVTTAPKQDQLSLHIWKELGRMFSRFDIGELTTLHLKIQDDWFAVGFVAGTAANESEISASKARGFHAEHMLVILEETTGIKQSVINAFLDTCTAPHNVIIAFGNPDHQLDTLHKFCTLDKVQHVRISALDHPNIVLKNPSFIVGATTEQSIKEKELRYGVDNPMYRSRVNGISPAQSHDSLIKLEWCYKALECAIEQGEKAIGIDVANSLEGDKAAIAYGEGNVLKSLESFQCPDANQLGHREAIHIREEGITKIGVDGTGVGAGTVNVLKEYDIAVNPLNGEVVLTDNEEDFNSLRSQMWWQAREDLRRGKVIPLRDEELFADLISPKWETRQGKICVEDKKAVKKRLGRSPDKGDAFVYWNWVRQNIELGTEVLFEI